MWLIKAEPFQSTLSLRRATGGSEAIIRGGGDFNPRSPCGERPAIFPRSLGTSTFQSTLSLRRATGNLRIREFHGKNFNPRSPCGERPDLPGIGGPKPDFNPRSPCGERRRGIFIRFPINIFQSTLSLRRATMVEAYQDGVQLISIHALLAESDLVFEGFTQEQAISIHALLAESDLRPR